MPDPSQPDALVAFRWRGRRYDVDQPLSSWRQVEWNGHRDRGEDRVYVRVLAHPSGALADGTVDADGFMATSSAVYDVYRNGSGWRISRIWD